eukprot:GFYU01000087.1.p1 GENE.GFYU01000087.1~~GFYU01000087.1.p1  ORF type:complete len:118 (-),score=20.20 GFYU01000087.1:188-541(-)
MATLLSVSDPLHEDLDVLEESLAQTVFSVVHLMPLAGVLAFSLGCSVFYGGVSNRHLQDSSLMFVAIAFFSVIASFVGVLFFLSLGVLGVPEAIAVVIAGDVFGYFFMLNAPSSFIH